VTSTGALIRGASAAFAAALALALAAPALAASVFTVTITTPNLGTIISGASGDTVFHIDSNTGNVTVTSGTGVRTGTGFGRSQVSIKCTGGGGDCGKQIDIQLTPIGATGRARPISTIIFTMGSAVLKGTPNFNGGSPKFVIDKIPSGQTKTFFVGGDLGIAGDNSGLPTGVAVSNFMLQLAESPADATTGPSSTGGFQATVIRGLSVAKASDLSFGSVGKPASGSGTVAVDASTGARTVSNGMVAVPTPTPTRALFNVTGEGGQLISVTVPATFQLSGPQAITVTTTNSAGPNPAISGALGSGGTFAFGVGGSAPIGASTPDGSYTGSFTVTVAYN